MWTRLLMRLFAVMLPLLALAQPAYAGTDAPPFKPFPVDAVTVAASIDREKPSTPPRIPLTGITVPHHLLAADLIARGFWAASATTPKRILLLTPDHFKRTRRPFATAARDFEYTGGLIATDREAADSLVAHGDLFEVSDLFEKEHGLQALLPYVAHFFPGARIVPVAVDIRAKRTDWDAAEPHLARLVDDTTLIVQSTDFSHYLPHQKAQQRDQEVLNILAAGNFDALAGLRQPDHLDSLGSQYLHMRLQATRYAARPIVIANANSQQYLKDPLGLTTSYIVQIYCRQDAAPASACGWRHKDAVYFAGDALFGRNFTRYLADNAVSAALISDIRSITGGAPLIINIEGVVIDEAPLRAGAQSMVMPVRTTLQWLAELNVVAVSLANNHTMDYGAEAFADMVRTLERAGVTTVAHGETKTIGPLRVLALTDVSNTGARRVDRVEPGEIEALPIADSRTARPLLAFLHWGEEGRATLRPREMELSDLLRRQSVSAIVGNHPHVASNYIEVLAGGETQVLPSLGNFLFDQLGPASSGAMLEVVVFEQGTFATRLIAIPNYYQLAIDLAARHQR